jgi:HK97 gp10 family phage protein
MEMFSAQLEGDLAGALDRLERALSDKVAWSGAAAAARVIFDEVCINVSGIRPGTPGIVTGNLLNSIYWAQNKRETTAVRKVYSVSWNRAEAPHGHLLEWGTATNPAYPFMRPAEARLPAAIEAGLRRMRERFGEINVAALV